MHQPRPHRTPSRLATRLRPVGIASQRAPSRRLTAPPAGGAQGVRERFARELERAKLEAMKELAYGASHEINNPLANIAMRAQSMLRDETDERRRKMLAAIHRQAMRAHEMISDLMLFARPPRLAPQRIDLAELAARVVEEYLPVAELRELRITTPGASTPVWCEADPVQMAVALRALVDNAIDAVGVGGEIVVSACRSGGRGVLSVSDNGPGVPAELREHIFDPFFSGREAGRGLGFGLSKCWRLVTDHGGEVRVADDRRAGAEFSIVLPIGD
ncbi:Sensor protein ZraS [Pseudobythopirellula maris]|uniref:histidine kinase n=1 Tax=Pseudobythopirellula maris TaxID=2527991 RepID=A0A5C5ZIV8_9BACT|nr:HAMP domain-containing sensor histidine kinase [Pseudobythopirellula maris]TWT86473.1 Sensor protein ZraS [Pseudobythopirellula maris]